MLIQKYGEKPEKIDVVYNSIDVNKFKPSLFNKNKIKTRFELDSSTKTIGFIGRLNHQKRPLLFVKLAKLFLNRPDYHFFIMGDGELKNRLNDETSHLPNIDLIAAESNPQWFYKLCDIMVFPSLFEGFPMVSLECAAMNTPFIASNITGFKEQIEMGNIGVLVELGDDDHIINQIESYLLNKWEYLLDIGKNGTSFIYKYLENNKSIDKQRKSLYL